MQRSLSADYRRGHRQAAEPRAVTRPGRTARGYFGDTLVSVTGAGSESIRGGRRRHRDRGRPLPDTTDQPRGHRPESRRRRTHPPPPGPARPPTRRRPPPRSTTPHTGRPPPPSRPRTAPARYHRPAPRSPTRKPPPPTVSLLTRWSRDGRQRWSPVPRSRRRRFGDRLPRRRPPDTTPLYMNYVASRSPISLPSPVSLLTRWSRDGRQRWSPVPRSRRRRFGDRLPRHSGASPLGCPVGRRRLVRQVAASGRSVASVAPVGTGRHLPAALASVLRSLLGHPARSTAARRRWGAPLGAGGSYGKSPPPGDRLHRLRRLGVDFSRPSRIDIVGARSRAPTSPPSARQAAPRHPGCPAASAPITVGGRHRLTDPDLGCGLQQAQPDRHSWRPKPGPHIAPQCQTGGASAHPANCSIRLDPGTPGHRDAGCLALARPHLPVARQRRLGGKLMVESDCACCTTRSTISCQLLDPPGPGYTGTPRRRLPGVSTSAPAGRTPDPVLANNKVPARTRCAGGVRAWSSGSSCGATTPRVPPSLCSTM